MKYIHALIALASAALFTATFTFAGDKGDVEVGHEVKLMVMSDAESIEIDGSDLEVGETRQFFTDSNKEVLVSREEDGFSITIDGEEVFTGGGHFFQGDALHGHGSHAGSHEKIFIQHLGDGEGQDIKIIRADGIVDVLADQEVEWQGGAGARKLVVRALDDLKSPAQHLEESGVLDKVDETTREEILKVLQDAALHHRVGTHRIIIEKGQEDDDENGDG